MTELHFFKDSVTKSYIPEFVGYNTQMKREANEKQNS